MYRTSIFIFRRDLRIKDNTGLNQALAISREVIPCFIFDLRQVGKQNSYRSLNCIQYMLASLKELDSDLRKQGGRLFLFYGEAEHVIQDLLTTIRASAVFANRDYTPFSRQRDDRMREVCKQYGTDFKLYGDSLLYEPEQVLKADGMPYQMFTPFYRRALAEPMRKVTVGEQSNFAKRELQGKYSITFDYIAHEEWARSFNEHIFLKGGREEALMLLNSLGRLSDYERTHDLLAHSTSGLSAPNKFGTVSIREVYYAMLDKARSPALIRQLYWRDFFTHLAFYTPSVFGHAYKPAYDNLAWSTDLSFFKRWCEGTTGFPLVDAAMTQLNTTGYMHNRARLVVGSFLTKDLHIDWREGERYFAQNLVDYDPSVNNGNWQWVASTGSDAQPYFRIFNPWLQQKKFDPDCSYIKRWLPAFKDVVSKSIHAWAKDGDSRIHPLPIVDHAVQAAYAQKLYRKAITKSLGRSGTTVERKRS